MSTESSQSAAANPIPASAYRAESLRRRSLAGIVSCQPMRSRIIFVAFAVVVLATVAANFLAGSKRARPLPSLKLACDVCPRAHRGSPSSFCDELWQSGIEMLGGVLIEYSDPANPEGYIPGEYHTLTNSRFELPPGATFQTICVGPTKHLKWRAHIGGIGQREVALKTTMRRVLNWTVILRRYPLCLYPEYAQTDWIAP